MEKKNIIYAHSGGVTSILNTTASSVISNARKHGIHTLIAQHGIIGLLHNNVYQSANLSDNDLQRLSNTPSSVFGSCRHKLPHHKDNPQAWDNFFTTIKQHNADAIMYHGGNDSQDTTLKIHQAAQQRNIPLQVYGIPKTIDNDLFGTDFCPGFPSCAKYLINSIQEASLDTYAMSKSSTKVFIMEVMGRHAGWLALSTGLASTTKDKGPHLILTPEHPVLIDNLLSNTKKMVESYGFCVIVASEGIIEQHSQQRFSQHNQVDAFGHQQMGGVAAKLAQLVQENLHYKTHYAIPDYLQRSAGHLRSTVDVAMAKKLGETAVSYYRQKAPDCLLGIVRNQTSWDIAPSSLDIAANKEKTVPSSFFSHDNMHISNTGRDYFTPLIQGESYPTYQNGVAHYFDPSILKHHNIKEYAE